jgi:hypothetical protein
MGTSGYMGNGFVTAIDDKIAWVWVLEKVPSTIPYPPLFFIISKLYLIKLNRHLILSFKVKQSAVYNAT